ncbi:MAG: hypothetical protein KJ955_04755 [Nanoarchaeota archaeon]|nr:hypothetical protein [Nanoarchaeota archaeon]
MKITLLAIIAASAIGCGEEKEAPFIPMEPDPNFGKVVDVQIPAECINLEKVMYENNIETIYCRDDNGVLTVYTRLMTQDVWTGRRYLPSDSSHQQ